MPAKLRRPFRRAVLLSLVSITIILLASAPRVRSTQLAVASSTRYSILLGSEPIASFDPGPADPSLSEARAQAVALQARRARLARLAALRRARRRADRARAVASLTPWRPSPPTTAGTFAVNWYAIAQCESGGRWTYNGSSGFDGGLQFLPTTWTALHMGYAYAWEAPAAVQIAAAEKLLAEVGGRGWTQWPICWWGQ